MKKIVKGNDFTLKIPVMKMVEGQAQAFPLPACTDVVVQVCNQFKRIPLAFEIDVKEDNVLLARVEGDKMSIGTYAIEVKGKIFGNDWRSNEYPQFAIVANNADADTEFGETDEGDNSVEMDTAMVIIPPTVELSDLINKANDALKTNKETNDTINTNEESRKEDETLRGTAEQGRVSAEEARVSSEGSRTKAEEGRVSAEAERVKAEQSRTEIEITRQTNELTRNDNETKRVAAEGERAKAEEARVDAENRRANAESERVDAEAQRASAESVRASAETGRASEEVERVKAEKKRKSDIDAAIQDLNTHRTEFDEAEAHRVSSENERVEAETTRKQTEADRVSAEGARVESEQARVDAETKRERDFDTAIQAAETATTGAETCNVELSGSTISVTNRNGETKSVDVINTDEEVTVTITSSVEPISVAGIKINVFLNNGKTPQSYTTNAEGKATFTIDRGNYYQVVFPEYGNAQPIAPVGYTAVLGSRNINVEYLPYDEDSMEKVVITATKYVENVGTAWEGIPVIVTVDRKDTTYQTDAKGQVTVFVPYKKEYTVRIDNQDGYYVSFNKNTRTYTATVPQRLLDYRMYQFKAGIFVVDENLNEYYIDNWVETGRDSEEVVALKVADSTLMINKGTFMIRTSDLRNMSKLPKLPWCTQQLLFTSIASNGNVSSDDNYYNGESSTFLIRQEAQERSLSVPAADYAYNQVFCIGGQDLHGFKMSAGQEFIHMANASSIKQILTTLYGEDVGNTYYNFVMNNWRWTSTQSNATTAWICSSSAGNYGKSFSGVVLPVFAC